MVRHDDGQFIGSAGRTIRWRSWSPDDEPSGAVVISHGYAEHGMRYRHVADRLVSVGFAVYAIDHHGHGRSAGSRGNVGSVVGVVRDLDHLIGLVTHAMTGRPVFLLGHSMGGLIALDHAGRASVDAVLPVAGVIVSAPAIEIAVGSPIERALAPIISRVLPNLPVTPLDSALISRDPAVVAAYRDDPLVYHGKVKARTGAELLSAAGRVTAALPRVTAPILFLHGTGDRIIPPSSSQAAADQVGSADVTLELFPDLYHEVFNEPEQDTVLDTLVDWLKQRT